MNDSHILHIDDEQEVRELVGFYLKKEGFRFSEADTAANGIEKIKTSEPHLILLDVRLPDIDGIELCKEIRSITNIPILFLSGKDSEVDRVLGLNVGGDDYIGKPFRMNELIARIKVHLRRHREFRQLQKANEFAQLSSASITLNRNTFDCFVHGEKVRLTTKEFELLYWFMNHPFQVFSIDQLIERLWGFESEIDSKTVLVHIGNLRRKLKENPRKPELILTIRGVGYKFNEAVQKV